MARTLTKPRMRYAWGEGKPFSGDAQKVGEALTNAKQDPDLIVETAAFEDSVLHRYFIWDDAAAADKQRLETARSLLRAVIIVGEDQEKVSRAFAYVKTDTEARYFTAAEISSDDARTRAYVDQAKREARVFRKKYADVRELAAVWDAIDRLDG